MLRARAARRALAAARATLATATVAALLGPVVATASPASALTTTSVFTRTVAVRAGGGAITPPYAVGGGAPFAANATNTIWAMISSDGQAVSPNLTDGSAHAFRGSLGGPTVRIDRNAAEGGSSRVMGVASDALGRYIAYSSGESGVGHPGLHVYDSSNGSREDVQSSSVVGGPGFAVPATIGFALSADGSTLVHAEPDGSTGRLRVLLTKLARPGVPQTTTTLSIDGPDEGEGDLLPTISGDGSTVAWVTQHPGEYPGGQAYGNGTPYPGPQVVTVDVTTATPAPAVVTRAPGGGTDVRVAERTPSLSDDGTVLGFAVEGSTSGWTAGTPVSRGIPGGVVRRVVGGDVTFEAAAPSVGNEACTSVESVAISGDGSAVGAVVSCPSGRVDDGRPVPTTRLAVRRSSGGRTRVLAPIEFAGTVMSFDHTGSSVLFEGRVSSGEGLTEAVLTGTAAGPAPTSAEKLLDDPLRVGTSLERELLVTGGACLTGASAPARPTDPDDVSTGTLYACPPSDTSPATPGLLQLTDGAADPDGLGALTYQRPLPLNAGLDLRFESTIRGADQLGIILSGGSRPANDGDVVDPTQPGGYGQANGLVGVLLDRTGASYFGESEVVTAFGPVTHIDPDTGTEDQSLQRIGSSGGFADQATLGGGAPADDGDVDGARRLVHVVVDQPLVTVSIAKPGGSEQQVLRANVGDLPDLAYLTLTGTRSTHDGSVAVRDVAATTTRYLPAKVEVGFAVPPSTGTQIPAGGTTELTIKATPTLDQGALRGPLEVELELSGGLTLEGTTSPGWSCDTVQLTCQTATVPYPSQAAPPLVVTLRAPDAENGAALAVLASAGDQGAPHLYSYREDFTLVGGGGGTTTTSSSSTSTTTGGTRPPRTAGADLATSLTVVRGTSFDAPAAASLLVDGPATATAAVRNLGARKADDVTATLQVPAGVTVSSLAGRIAGEWSCVLANLTCTRTATLSPGAAAGPIDAGLTAAAGAGSAVALTATASTSTTDADRTNDAVTRTLPVVAEGEAGAVAVALTGARTLPRDGAADVVASLANTTTKAVDGPLTLDVAVPTTLAGADAAITTASGDGWTCTILRPGVGSLARCHRDGGLGAGATAPPLTVHLVAGPTAEPGARVAVRADLRVRGGKQTTAGAATTIPIVTTTRAALRVATTLAGRTPAGTETTATLAVANDGRAPTGGTTRVVVPSAAGLAVTSAEGDGWTCTGSGVAPARVLSCATDRRIDPGASAPPITVHVLPAEGPGTVVLTSSASGADLAGPLAATGVGVAVREANRSARLVTQRVPVTSAPGHSAFTLNLTNVGDLPTATAPELTAELPAGSTATATGDGWTCTQVGSRLVCSRIPGPVSALGPGTSAPAVHVEVQGGPLAGGAPAAITTTASTLDAFGRRSTIVDSGVAIPDDSAPVALPIPLQLQVDRTPVAPGGRASLSVGVDTAYEQRSRSVVVVVSIPVGGDFPSLPLAVASPAAAPGAPGAPRPSAISAPSLPKPPVTGGKLTAWECKRATATQVACVRTSFLATVPLGLTVDVVVPRGVSGTTTFTAGTVSATTATTPLARLDEVTARLGQPGGASIVNGLSSTDVRVEGFTADAGVDQRLDAVGRDPETGARTPTVVHLDATKTSASGRTQAFAWTQVAGPAVAWQHPANEPRPNPLVVPAGGHPDDTASTGVPSFPEGTDLGQLLGGAAQAFGDRPTFTLGTIRDAATVRFRVAATDGLMTSTDEVEVALSPPDDQPPIVTLGAATIKHGSAEAVPLGAAVVPVAGDVIEVPIESSDPDGDQVTLTADVSKPRAPRVTPTIQTVPRAGGGGGKVRSARLTWPANATSVELAVTGADGRSIDGRPVIAVATRTLGVPPPPLTVSIDRTAPTGGAPIAAGSTATLTARIPAAAAATTTKYDWTLDGQVQSGHAADLQIAVPSTAQTGSTIHVELKASTGTGTEKRTATATYDLPVGPIAPVTAKVTGQGTLAVQPGAGLDLPGSAKGPDGQAVTGATFAWSLVSGPGALTQSTAPTARLTVPGGTAPATTVVRLVVTTPAGATDDVLVPIVVGTPAAAGDCLASDLRSLVNSNVPSKVLHVGDLTIDFGTVVLTGDPSTECSATGTTVTFSGASVQVGQGLVGLANLSGTIDRHHIVFATGTARFPREWQLPDISLGVGPTGSPTPGTPFTIDLDQGTVAGTLTFAGLPFLTLPPGASVVTSVTIGGNEGARTVVLDADAHLTRGGRLLLGASVTLGANRTITVDVKAGSHLLVFGEDLQLSGSITHTPTTTTRSIHASVAGPIDGPAGLKLSNLSVSWDPDVIKATANADVAGLSAQATGEIRGDDLAFTLHATRSPQAGDPSVLTSLGPLSFDGTFTRKANVDTIDLRSAAQPTWSPDPSVDIVSAAIRLTNVAPVSTSPCATVVPTGKVWLSVSGQAKVKLGGPLPSVTIGAEGCIVPSTPADWAIGTTANLNGFRPIAAVDVRLDSVALTVLHRAGSPITISLSATASYKTQSFGAAIVYPVGQAPYLDLTAPDLSTLGLPVKAGHIVIPFGDIPSLVINVAKTAASGAAGSVGAASPPAHTASTRAAATSPSPSTTQAVTLTNLALGQIRVLAPIDLPVAVTDFTRQKLGFTVDGLAVQAEISGSGGVTLTARLTVPALVLIGNANDQSKTRLTLSNLDLFVSTSGKVGFAAGGDLFLPGDGNTKQSSTLNVKAAFSITPAPVPAFTISASFTSPDQQPGGPCPGTSLGITGLCVTKAVIEGGVVFNPAGAVPTIGFGATVSDVPQVLKDKLGLLISPSEPAELVVNISPDAPILKLRLGTANGQPVAKPLTVLGGSHADDLLIDVLDVVFAPVGGTVGPYTFSPGISLVFAATILHTDLSVKAVFDPAAALTGGKFLSADINVSAFDAGPLSLKQAALHLELSTQGMLFKVDGQATLGQTQLGVHVEAKALRPTGPDDDQAGFRLHLQTDASDLPLGKVATLRAFTLTADAYLASAAPLPQLTLSAAGTLETLHHSLTVVGSVTATPGAGITGMSLAGVASPFDLGPTHIGAGPQPCADPRPDKVGQNLHNPGAGGDGPCFSLGIAPLETTPFTLAFGGSISIGNVAVAASGRFDDTGIDVQGTLAMGTDQTRVQLSGAFSGHVWFGTGLANVTTRDTNGQDVPVHAGDVRLAAAATCGSAAACSTASTTSSRSATSSTSGAPSTPGPSGPRPASTRSSGPRSAATCRSRRRAPRPSPSAPAGWPAPRSCWPRTHPRTRSA